MRYTTEAGHLAEQALLAGLAAFDVDGHSAYTPLPGGEAEALIRTGWTPPSAARRARKAGR